MRRRRGRGGEGIRGGRIKIPCLIFSTFEVDQNSAKNNKLLPTVGLGRRTLGPLTN